MSKKTVIKARFILGLMLVCMAAAVSARLSAGLGIPDGGVLELPTIHAYLHLSEFSEIAEEPLPTPPPPTNPIFVEQTVHRVPQPVFHALSADYIRQLGDFDYLTRSIFLSDPRTRLLPADIDIPRFLEKDLTIDTTVDGPQVLIFHAHSMEMFADSDPSDAMTGVLGVGAYLAEILENEHGISVMHHMERFDMVGGRAQRAGAYERLDPVIRRILRDNPSIQMVIDLHRDGVGPHVAPMVTYIDGERVARIMFVNGLLRRYVNGSVIPVTHLHNPYLAYNLAFSLNLQLAANQMYPGLARRIYLLPFRYSLHMAPLSILLEVGAQNNTLQEALNAMPHVANIIASVILEN